LSIWRAAACSEGRSPRETSDISSTTVENSSSRGYWRCRLASNTSSTQAAGIARSNASRAMTLAGACFSNRARISSHIALPHRWFSGGEFTQGYV